MKNKQIVSVILTMTLMISAVSIVSAEETMDILNEAPNQYQAIEETEDNGLNEYSKEEESTNFDGKLLSVKLNGIYEPYQYIKGSYEFDEKASEADVISKKWYWSNSKDKGWTDAGVDTDTFYTGADYAEKWIKFEVTLKDNKAYTSDPKQIGKLWNYQVWRIHNTEKSKFDTVNKTSPKEYIFTFEEQEFVLLDSTESDSAAFLVMAKDTYGTRKFFSVDRHQSFEELNEWLNTTFRSVGNSGKKLPDKLMKYIDFKQGWQTEAGQSIGCKGYTGGISIPAMTEVLKYSSKIGLQDSGEDWWTRSPATPEYGDGNTLTYVCGSDDMLGQTYGAHGTWNQKSIRPIFYLSRDFFIDNKMDLTTTGAEVCKEIGKRYKKSELAEMYSVKELEDVFGFEPDYSVVCYPMGDIDDEIFECFCEVTNRLEDRNPGALMLCIYDAENRLVAMDIKSVQLLGGKKAVVDFAIENIPEGAGKRAEIYLLDPDNGFSPVSYRGIIE